MQKCESLLTFKKKTEVQNRQAKTQSSNRQRVNQGGRQNITGQAGKLVYIYKQAKVKKPE